MIKALFQWNHARNHVIFFFGRGEDTNLPGNRLTDVTVKGAI